MKDNETIDEMFGWFQTILSGLKSLETKFSQTHNNLKILESLPKVWELKATSISKAHHLKTLTLDELLKTLRVHEVYLNNKGCLKANDFFSLRTGETIKDECPTLEK
uniref:UBN2 domain-containing protein n=1 Tax=Cajanus cajan TaxID=3821 RepID=A0A151RWQ7_CAJCA|nr:hypothetical protein KK1_031401 [Cajanus cajan]